MYNLNPRNSWESGRSMSVQPVARGENQSVQDGSRSVAVASQRLSWFLGQLLRVRYSIHAYRPAGLFQREDECCLILAPTHQTTLDPWLLACALSYRRWRALLPVRILATQDFRGAMRWFKPLIKILYRLGGVVELPPESRDNIPMPEKVQPLIDALKQGEIVMIFPEGEIWRRREPPIGKFARGVVYVHRASGAPVVPIAVWMGECGGPRRRYSVRIGNPVRIPEHLDLDAGAEWLRQRALELYDQAKKAEER
jgi:1-acyl-sn-glycerol-3-phosphate acyltransferase